MTLSPVFRGWLASLLMMAALVLPAAPSVAATSAESRPLIVQDGRPLAQIIIAPDAPRPVPVAARELQNGIRRISGAEIPIHNQPVDGIPVRIYVGQSQYTRELGIDVSDLKHGAFRMVSGDNWLALVGNDSNYVFREPYARTTEDRGKVQAEWERLAGGKWMAPYGTSPLRHYNADLDLWYQDERGSVNAVYRYLMDLGARWFLPSELGEVWPEIKTLALPKVDVTVRPDFALRYPHSRATFRNTSEALWAMRLGWNTASDITGPSVIKAVAHGMLGVVNHPENRAAHPEFFVVLNGKRFMPAKNPSFCLSSEELLDQNVRFLRATFDLYDPLMVSVQPADGNVIICQCEKCAGKATPERGRRGEASDYVWEYINKVAIELYKTHLTKKIAALAYANYQLPPTRIAQLSPNIIVGTPSGRTFTHNNAQEVELIRQIRQQWLDKMPEGSKLTYHYEYFMDARPGRRTESLPVFVTGTLAQSLREVKGISLGEHIDVERYREGLVDLGVMHLNLYVVSRLWWDADLDLQALLEEYYRLYYGPAAAQMKEVVTFAEANWPQMPSDPQKITTYFKLLEAAQAAAPADSVYAKRIDLLWQYTKPMKGILEKVERGREESVPPVVLRGPRPQVKRADITIDGKLDENVWQQLPGRGTPERLNLPTYELRDIVTGAKPAHGTTFKVFWAEDALYLGIRCEEPDTANLNIGTRARDDSAIWRGDLVELHLETQTHSYYAIVVNPAGAMVDLDWKNRARETGWDSNAEAATHVGDGFWSVEMRIPIVDAMEAEIVELGTKGVVGSRPTRLYPWYMNLARQRIRGEDKEMTMYSPTGKRNFHDPFHFARLSPAR